jgi:hypothetical protein
MYSINPPASFEHFAPRFTTSYWVPAPIILRVPVQTSQSPAMPIQEPKAQATTGISNTKGPRRLILKLNYGKGSSVSQSTSSQGQASGADLPSTSAQSSTIKRPRGRPPGTKNKNPRRSETSSRKRKAPQTINK